jgi:hypothetical protein
MKPRDLIGSGPGTTRQTSRGKLDNLLCTAAGFTLPALDGYGLRYLTLPRPAFTLIYPVPVRRLAPLLHASFRPPPHDDALALR